MALTKYKEKRNFKVSPESKGGSPDNDKLRFVIQKHEASRLHYDFRLEMENIATSASNQHRWPGLYRES